MTVKAHPKDEILENDKNETMEQALHEKWLKRQMSKMEEKAHLDNEKMENKHRIQQGMCQDWAKCHYFRRITWVY